MPRALALETSGRTGSVALADDATILAEDTFPHGLQHAAELVPRIDALLRARGWSPRDLQEIYISAGPGSFTGLRIGVTLAKTLSMATGARLVAVPSVEVLARNAPPEARHAIIVLDAKRDQVFTARLTRGERSDDWTVVEPAHVEALADVLERSPRPVHLIGEGMPFHRRFIPPGDDSIIITSETNWRARASIVAAIGHRMAREGSFTPAEALVPIYIRKPEAEEKWDAAHAT